MVFIYSTISLLNNCNNGEQQQCCKCVLLTYFLPARRDTAIFFYQPRFGFNDLPSFLPASLSGQLRVATVFFPSIPPCFCPQLLAIISCWEHLLHKVSWYSWQCEAPQGWLYMRMLKNPGRKYPTEQGGFLSI